MSRTTRAILGVILGLLTAQAAWAAAVRLTVTDETGRPVEGATVKLGDVETTTGADGLTPTLEVKDGEHQAVITFRGTTFRQRIVVRGGAGIQQIPMTFRPTRDYLQEGFWPRGRAALGVGVAQDRGDDSVLVQQNIVTRTAAAAGTSGTTTQNRTGAELDQENKKDKRHTIGPIVSTWFTLPLAQGASPFGAFDRTQAPSSTPMGSGGWRVVPSITAGVGQADVQFESLDDQQPINSNTFTGRTPVLTVGGSAMFLPCAGCRWYGSVGFVHSRTSNATVKRAPVLQTILPTGYREVRDEVEYRYQSNVITAVIGRQAQRVAVWGGARVGARRAFLNGEFELDLSGAGFQGVRQTVTFKNRFERNSTEALGGVDVRLGRLPLVIQLEASTNGKQSSFRTGLGWSIGS